MNADAPAERFLIGGNIMDNGPTYYGRYHNQAVIIRAQRPDIQLASMLPQTRFLLLTRPGDPTDYVKACHYAALLEQHAGAETLAPSSPDAPSSGQGQTSI